MGIGDWSRAGVGRSGRDRSSQFVTGILDEGQQPLLAETPLYDGAPGASSSYFEMDRNQRRRSWRGMLAGNRVASLAAVVFGLHVRGGA